MLVEFDYYKSKAVVEMTADGHIKSIRSIVNKAGFDITKLVARDEGHMKRLVVKAREAAKAKRGKQ